MNNWRHTVDPRTEELLADQAITGLDDQQAIELLKLLEADSIELQDEFMRTASLVQLGMLSQERQALKPMPEQLRNRILAAAPKLKSVDTTIQTTDTNIIDFRAAQDRAENPAPGKPAASSLLNYTGWALAAMLALALVVVRTDPGTGSAPNFAAQRASLISDISDAVVTAWSKPDDPQFSNVTGDVVWSDSLQAGYLRLSGIPANDPAVKQYQLWIVDPERSAQPVDGGVFDVQAGQQEVIIPITAKLAVNNPAAFAITLEQPGGVVVSAGPLLVIASAGG